MKADQDSREILSNLLFHIVAVQPAPFWIYFGYAQTRKRLETTPWDTQEGVHVDYFYLLSNFSRHKIRLMEQYCLLVCKMFLLHQIRRKSEKL